MDIIERMAEYDKDWCWQYDIRRNNLENDLKEASLTRIDAMQLKVEDFVFKPLETVEDRRLAAQFIYKHEWLGSLSMYTSHWFGTFYKDILAGVVLMGMPNAFSNLMGEDTRKIERLINRGACISWSPKNLASNLIMESIRWMVKNSPYRLFTAYSDPQAKELGTIYQACNFYYLGQTSGGTLKYKNPYTGKMVSDRFFRQRSAYKRYAIDLGIDWQKEWNTNDKIHWDRMPKTVEIQLRDYGKKMQESSEEIIVAKKHKYAYVLGKDKKETRELRKRFLALTPTFPYPTVR